MRILDQRRAGVHTFSRTFDTHFNLNAASPTGTMRLMRQHSTTLATRTYMDGTQVEKWRDLERLAPLAASLMATPKPDTERETMGKPDSSCKSDLHQETLKKSMNSNKKVVFQPEMEGAEWRREGDSNPLLKIRN